MSPIWVFRIIAIILWSWGCGFVLGSLSGRAAWFTWLTFYLVVRDSGVGKICHLRKYPSPGPASAAIACRRPLAAQHPGSSLCTPGSLWSVMGAAPARANVALSIPVCRRRHDSSRKQSSQHMEQRMAGQAFDLWRSGVWRGPWWPERLVPFALAGWPTVWLLLATCHEQRNNERKLA